MLYNVKYKRVSSIFWKTISKVKGDGFIDENNGSRFFILHDESRVEVPVQDVMFKFPKERFISIKKNMEQTTNTPIQTK